MAAPMFFPYSVVALVSVLTVACGGLRQQRSLLTAAEADPVPYTVRINTFKRQDCLREVIFAWRSCEPAQIRIVWSEGKDEIPSWLHTLVERRLVAIDVYESTNLTNRFKPADFITDYVFSVDDDVVYSCRTMNMAAKLLRDHPHMMVGFAPRLFTKDSGDAWLSSWRTGRANTVLPTKGAFMHGFMYQEFFAENLKQIRDKIDEQVTAEDILMAHVHANVSRRSVVPLALRAGDSLELQCGDKLTTGGEKGGQRQALYDEIVEHFGDVFEGLDTEVLVLNTAQNTYAGMSNVGQSYFATSAVDEDERVTGMDLCCEQHPSCCNVDIRS